MNYLKSGILILALSQANLNAIENLTEERPIGPQTKTEEVIQSHRRLIGSLRGALQDTEEYAADDEPVLTRRTSLRMIPEQESELPVREATGEAQTAIGNRRLKAAALAALTVSKNSASENPNTPAPEERKARVQLPTEIKDAVTRARERVIKAKDPALDPLLRSSHAASRDAADKA